MYTHGRESEIKKKHVSSDLEYITDFKNNFGVLPPQKKQKVETYSLTDNSSDNISCYKSELRLSDNVPENSSNKSIAACYDSSESIFEFKCSCGSILKSKKKENLKYISKRHINESKKHHKTNVLEEHKLDRKLNTSNIVSHKTMESKKLLDQYLETNHVPFVANTNSSIDITVQKKIGIALHFIDLQVLFATNTKNGLFDFLYKKIKFDINTIHEQLSENKIEQFHTLPNINNTFGYSVDSKSSDELSETNTYTQAMTVEKKCNLYEFNCSCGFTMKQKIMFLFCKHALDHIKKNHDDHTLNEDMKTFNQLSEKYKSSNFTTVTYICKCDTILNCTENVMKLRKAKHLKTMKHQNYLKALKKHETATLH